jgi:Protein of unknown function (DUF3237)
MELVHEFTFTAEVNAPVAVGEGPFGNRMIFEVTGGTVTGERISGRVGSGGGDWLLVGSDGFNRLDIRFTVETDDGAFLYAQCPGVMEFNDAAGAAVNGERASEYEEHYVRIAPRLETGDERYAWVNQTLFVGDGRILPGPVVEYRVHRVT